VGFSVLLRRLFVLTTAANGVLDVSACRIARGVRVLLSMQRIDSCTAHVCAVHMARTNLLLAAAAAAAAAAVASASSAPGGPRDTGRAAPPGAGSRALQASSCSLRYQGFYNGQVAMQTGSLNFIFSGNETEIERAYAAVPRVGVLFDMTGA
jgi:hypothetical protein